MAESEEDMDTDSSLMGGGSQMSLRILTAPRTRQKQVSVLILTPQWTFDGHGTSGITKSLIKNLRSIDPEGIFVKITCTMLEEEGRIEQIREAEDLKVQLKGYIQPRSTMSRQTKKEADLQWLNEDVVKYYSHVVLEMKYDFIIGHAPYFVDGCFNLRNSCRGSNRGHTPKVILFVHELPQNENGETNKPLLRDWLYEADVVYSMEKSTRDEIAVQMRGIKEEQAPQHKTYIPGYPIELFKIKRGEPEIMMIMPMKKNEMEGFHFSLAVNAVSGACAGSMQMTLTMLIKNKSDKEEWEKEYSRILRGTNQHLTFRCKPIENEDELKDQLKKSDLFLFPLEVSSSLFSEEALSAIASGVPVLVSSQSGVGSFLVEMYETDSVVQQMDEKLWTERIIQKINDRVTSQGKAKDLREHLLLDTSVASIHQDFVKMICDAGCTEIEVTMAAKEKVTETAKVIGRNIGLSDIDMCNPETYAIAFFEKIFLLREKLKEGLLEGNIGKATQQKWQKLLLSLEDIKRKLIHIRRGSIIFTLFCPTQESFLETRKDRWMTNVAKGIAELLEVLGFPKPRCTFDELSSSLQPGDYQEDPLRRAKYREQKIQTSQSTAIIGTRKLQIMDTTDEVSQQDPRELTDGRLHKLSTTFANESDLRELGVKGLHLKTIVIDAHIYNYRNDICSAAYYTLKDWCQSQPNRTIAYETLCDALKKADMQLKIVEALQ